MKRFTTLHATMAPLPRHDVDTDQIIPARYLRGTTRDGVGQGLFASWRYDEGGAPDPTFVLNRPPYQEARILVVGRNFGCGSSREHAAWALKEYGFRAVIGASFADIFRNNALKNGLLPVALPEAVVERLARLAEGAPEAALTVDLAAQRVTLPDGSAFRFDIDPFNKRCLLEGMDQLGYLLWHEPAIAAYEARSEGGPSD
ncbi:MAG: 3-isopropylmalate dehydratase small subunit [Candidatus Promineifilaceae bacterium]|nr:3-isopropylmalate dehydratase small subunit [Candidatus Promineifilaceae bacterium]